MQPDVWQLQRGSRGFRHTDVPRGAPFDCREFRMCGRRVQIDVYRSCVTHYGSEASRVVVMTMTEREHVRVFELDP